MTYPKHLSKVYGLLRSYMNNVEFDFKEISYDDSGAVQIQYVMIMNKNANHPFSKFIGKNDDDVLRKYSKNIDYEKSNSELRYDSEDWTSFIQFNIKDEKVSRIVIGKNL